MKRFLVLSLLACHFLALDTFSLFRQTLEKGNKYSWTGEQVNLIVTRKGSFMVKGLVKWASPSKWRIDLTSPPPMRGTAILKREEGLFILKPKGHHAFPPSFLPHDTLDIHLDLLSKSATVVFLSETKIMGRTALGFLIKPAHIKGGYIKVWLDKATGIRLRTERFSHSGQLLSTTYLASLEPAPSLKKEEFNLPFKAPHPRHFSQEEIRQMVGFAPLLPSYLPPGYAILHMSPLRMGRYSALLIHLTDGLNPITILQTSFPYKTLPPPPYGQQSLLLNMGGKSIIVTGNVDKVVLERIGKSLR